MRKSEHMLVRIVHKKTDGWYIKWQRVVQRVTKSGNEWQREVQRMTMGGTTSGTTNGNEWCNEWKQMRVILGFRMKQLCNVKVQYIIYSATSFWKYNFKQNFSRNSHRRCCIKKLLLAILQYSLENTWRSATLLKRDSNKIVFLWTLQIF